MLIYFQKRIHCDAFVICCKLDEWITNITIVLFQLLVQSRRLKCSKTIHKVRIHTNTYINIKKMHKSERNPRRRKEETRDVTSHSLHRNARSILNIRIRYSLLLCRWTIFVRKVNEMDISGSKCTEEKYRRSGWKVAVREGEREMVC